MPIIDFQKAKEERDPHRSGAAECMLCKNQWQAVAPVGTLWLECPSCGSEKGHFLGMDTHEDRECFVCNCGNHLFVLGTSGTALCPNCGIEHAEYDFLEE